VEEGDMKTLAATILALTVLVTAREATMRALSGGDRPGMD
jgi:hypothetical protein